MKIGLLILTISFVSHTWAAKPVVNSQIREIKLTAIYGSKVSHFEIAKVGNRYQLQVQTSYGEHAKRDLREKDLKFFTKKFEDLPNQNKIPVECSRLSITTTRINTKGKNQTKAACLRLNDPNDVKFVRFVNLMAAAL